MALPFKNNLAKKKLTQSKLKLTHPTKIKLTLKLDSNVISLLAAWCFWARGKRVIVKICQRVASRHWRTECSVEWNWDKLEQALKPNRKFTGYLLDLSSSEMMEPTVLTLLEVWFKPNFNLPIYNLWGTIFKTRRLRYT